MKNRLRARARVRALARFFDFLFFQKRPLFSENVCMKDFLSQEERDRLKAQHKKDRDKRICYRINAVLLHDQGWSVQEIAEALFL